MESREGCGLRLHRSLKYLIYDNAPAKLLISGGESPTAKTHEAEGLVEFQERNEAQPFTSLGTLAKNNTIFQASKFQSYNPYFPANESPTVRRGSWTQGPSLLSPQVPVLLTLFPLALLAP